MNTSFLRKLIKKEDGQPIVEFALVIPLFLMFLSGLFIYGWWFIANIFLQDASFESARKYAVALDQSSAEGYFKYPANRWGYLFVDPNSISLNLSNDGEKAIAMVRGESRFKHFMVFTVPTIEVKSEIPLEYRFREPNDFDWWWK